METKFILFITTALCFTSLTVFSQLDQLDNSFGIGGKTTASIGLGSTAYGIAVQSNGRIVAAGLSYNGSNNDIALFRFKANGTSDNSFGTAGKVITDFGANEMATSVNMQGSKIVVAGNCPTGFCLVRYNSDGTVDASFGIGGETITTFGGNGGQCNGSVIQPDGKIVAAGVSNGSFVIVRYKQNGNIDNTFGTGGILVAVSSTNGYYNVANAIALQADGKIVAAGVTGIGSLRDYLVVRATTSGVLDNAFDGDGIVTTDFGNFGLNDFAYGLAINASGKIYVTGLSSGQETSDFSVFSVACYKTNGQLNSNFGGTGKVLTDFDGFDNGGNKPVVLPDGKLIVAGTLYAPNLTGFIKYKPSGALDASYGSSGKLTTNYKRPTAAVLQSDGKLLVAASESIFTIVRYKNDPPFSIANADGYDFSNAVKAPGITLSPNPAKDVLKISNLNASSQSSLSVINSSGKIVLKTSTANSHYSLNIKSLQSGIYYLHIISSGKMTDLKFVKE